MNSNGAGGRCLPAPCPSLPDLALEVHPVSYERIRCGLPGFGLSKTLPETLEEDIEDTPCRHIIIYVTYLDDDFRLQAPQPLRPIPGRDSDWSGIPCTLALTLDAAG